MWQEKVASEGQLWCHERKKGRHYISCTAGRAPGEGLGSREWAARSLPCFEQRNHGASPGLEGSGPAGLTGGVDVRKKLAFTLIPPERRGAGPAGRVTSMSQPLTCEQAASRGERDFADSMN